MKYLFAYVLMLMASIAFGQSEEEKRLLDHLDIAQEEHYAEAVVALFTHLQVNYEDSSRVYQYPKEYFNYLLKADSLLDDADDAALKAQLSYFKFKYHHYTHTAAQLIAEFRWLTQSEHLLLIQQLKLIDGLIYQARIGGLYPEYFELLTLKAKWYSLNDFDGDAFSEKVEVGNVYYKMKHYNEAISNYLEAIEENDSPRNHLVNSSLLNNVGICYRELLAYDSAKFYFTKAIALLDKSDFEDEPYRLYFRDVIASNRAELLLQKGDFYTPVPFIEKTIVGAQKFDEGHIVRYGYYTLAVIYVSRNDPKTALKYLDMVLQNPKYNGVGADMLKSLRIKGRVLLQLGKTDEASETFRRVDFLKDSLDAINNKSEMESMLISFQAKEKEREIEEQKIRIAERDNTILLQDQTKNILQISLGAAGLLIVVVFFFVFYQRKTKRIIEQQKIEVNKALLQKGILLKEIHHRVKNNLQVISGLLHLQSTQTEFEEVKELMQKGQIRVDAMAVLHQLLYQGNVKTINMKDYLKELLHQVKAGYSFNSNVEVNLDCEQVEVNVDKASALGLIATELLSNAFKYAFTENRGGIVKIGLHQLPTGEFEFIVSDNGVGFPDGVDPSQSGSLGLKLVNMLSKQIRATLVINNNNGVECILKFAL